MKRKNIADHVVLLEILGFGLVMLFLWLDELLDLPHLFLGAPVTPFNWRESVFETLLTAGLAAVVILLTRTILRRVRYLEGFMLFCSGCKKVRVGGEWIDADTYLHDHSDVVVSHGLCPDCIHKYAAGWINPDAKAG